MPANADNAKEVTKVDQDQINQFARYNQQERVEKMVYGLFTGKVFLFFFRTKQSKLTIYSVKIILAICSKNMADLIKSKINFAL